MPSGPKKRMRARRKKQGSPVTTDAGNSDRETELSVCESVDYQNDDIETPGSKGRSEARPAFDDKDAVSSQTEEWVRVSDFDIGTPTSQSTAEYEVSADDAGFSNVRRSLDKLAEWETVSGENLPERQEGSSESIEEDPSELETEGNAGEVASADSNESFVMESPPTQGKDGDTSDSGRSSSSSSSSSSDSGSSVPAAGDPEAVSSGSEIADSELETKMSKNVQDLDQDDASREDDSLQAFEAGGSSGKAAEFEVKDIAEDAAETIFASTPDEEKQIDFENAKDISEVETPLVGDLPDEDKQVVSFVGEKNHSNDLQIPDSSYTTDEDKEVVTVATDEMATPPNDSESSVDVSEDSFTVDKEVASTTGEDRPEAAMELSAFSADVGLPEDKEVASTSAETEDSKANSESGRGNGTAVHWPADSTELEHASSKEIPGSTHSNPAALCATAADKLGVKVPTKSHTEGSSSGGCCGVIYWLFGWSD